MTDLYVEKALKEILSEFASNRVYLMRAPQNVTQPFIIYRRTDSDRIRHINGPSGLVFASFQIDVYANKPYDAKDIASAIQTKLDGFRDTVYYGSNSPQDSIRIAGISLQNEFDDLSEQDAEPYLYRNTMIFLVKYEQ